MRAFILAGGLGTRLKTVVHDRPKPLADIDSKPFLEHQLEMLKDHGVSDVVLCVGYLHEQIQEYFGSGRDRGIEIHYSIEDQPLGTAGALKHAAQYVTGTFLLLNGDTYFDIDLARLIGFHHNLRNHYSRVLGTLALTEVRDGRSYGSVAVDAKGRIEQFAEKRPDLASCCQVSAGIYVLEPEILDFIPAGQKVSLECDTFPTVLAEHQSLLGYPAQGFFVDIGTPDGYYSFQDYVKGA